MRALFPAIGESAPLCARTLRAHVIRPMVSQLGTHRERHRSPTADPRAARRMLTMMGVLSSLGCHPLYAAAECRAPVVLALCEPLSWWKVAVDRHRPLCLPGPSEGPGRACAPRSSA